MWLRRREKESQEGRRDESLGWVVLYLFFFPPPGGLGAAESLGQVLGISSLNSLVLTCQVGFAGRKGGE